MTAIERSDFAWVQDPGLTFLNEACCISVITSATIQDVFEALHPADERFEATLDDLNDRMM